MEKYVRVYFGRSYFFGVEYHTSAFYFEIKPPNRYRIVLYLLRFATIFFSTTLQTTTLHMLSAFVVLTDLEVDFENIAPRVFLYRSF